MASACGLIGQNGCSSSSWVQLRGRSMRKKKSGHRKGVKVSCSLYSQSVMDPYKTLRIQPGASESEVKKAFRQLALQVCSSSPLPFLLPSCPSLSGLIKPSAILGLDNKSAPKRLRLS